MSIPLSVAGVQYTYPENGDTGLAAQATAWAKAVTAELNAATDANPELRVHISTPQSGISSLTTVKFDVVDYDSAGGYSASTGQYTVPVGGAGWYLVCASVLTSQSGSTGNQSLQVFMGGVATAQAIAHDISNGSSNAACCVSAMRELADGDTVYVQLATGAGTVATVGDTTSSMSLKRIV